jgi:hypothetical protein
MGYSHFILVSVDEIKKVHGKTEKSLKKTYKELKSSIKKYPIFGQDEDGWYTDEEELLNNFKALTTKFPLLTFTFHCFIESNGGAYGIFFIIKNDALVERHEENFDRTFIKVNTTSNRVIEFGVSLNCESTYVKNNITCIFNEEYGYEY